MQLFKYLRYKWKKKFDNMNQQNDALLANYKRQYFGKVYQWVRPINNETPGEIVRVVDVKLRGDMVLLVFNSGTPINVDLAETYLKKVSDSFDPPADATTVNPQQSGGPIDIPEDLKSYTTPKQPISFSDTPQGNAQQVHQEMQSTPVKKKQDLFAMFQSEEKEINLPITVKMPDIALVKMMYQNASDKDVFLAELSEYIIESISVDVAKNAIRTVLDPEWTIKKQNEDDKQQPAADSQE